MLILRVNRSKGRKQKRPLYLNVIQNEDDTLLISQRDGTPLPHAGLFVVQHGGILGTLVRCLEFDGTIDEYLASKSRKEIRAEWEIINKRWHEFLEYQKSLEVSPPLEEIS